MIPAILTVIGTALTLWLFYAKKKAKKKTPNETSKESIEKMDDAIAHGDADRISLEFNELFEDADRNDPGQHEAPKNGGREGMDRD